MVAAFIFETDNQRHVRMRPPPDWPKPIVLVGMHGSGKTTVGKILAQKLGRTLYETDFMLSKRYFSKVSELIIKLGIAFFRRSEAWVLRHAMTHYKNIVVG